MPTGSESLGKGRLHETGARRSPFGCWATSVSRHSSLLSHWPNVTPDERGDATKIFTSNSQALTAELRWWSSLRGSGLAMGRWETAGLGWFGEALGRAEQGCEGREDGKGDETLVMASVKLLPCSCTSWRPGILGKFGPLPQSIFAGLARLDQMSDGRTCSKEDDGHVRSLPFGLVWLAREKEISRGLLALSLVAAALEICHRFLLTRCGFACLEFCCSPLLDRPPPSPERPAAPFALRLVHEVVVCPSRSSPKSYSSRTRPRHRTSTPRPLSLHLLPPLTSTSTEVDARLSVRAHRIPRLSAGSARMQEWHRHYSRSSSKHGPYLKP
ncbi:hypothetical protein V8E51_014863 [Hyaloscypha variabilis]